MENQCSFLPPPCFHSFLCPRLTLLQNPLLLLLPDLSQCTNCPQPGHLGLNPHSRSCLIHGTLPKAQAPLTIIPEDYLSLLPSECTSKTVTVLLRLNRDFSNPTLQIPTNMNPVQKSFWQPKLSPWAVPWPSLLCVSKTRLHNSTGLELSSTENLRILSGLKRLKHN